MRRQHRQHRESRPQSQAVGRPDRVPLRRIARAFRLSLGFALVVLLAMPASAFRLIGSPSGWARWDAAPRYVGGEERSLDGGLRYSIETGSYAGLRDQFIWIGTPPSAQAFADTIARAFEHWEVVDVSTGLPAAFHFVEDLATTAIDQPGSIGDPNSYLGLNAGAEIDLFAATPHAGPEFGASVIFFVDTTENDLALSSGVLNYAGLAITGADIRINPIFAWSLNAFEILLTHEIGHALGLADLEADVSSGVVSGFLDDDYDPTNNATALATLTNSFALMIDPLDPEASGLQSYVASLATAPGLESAGVELLMESSGLFDLTFASQKLQNDDVAGRQFLYPVVVPEPSLGLMLAVGTATLGIAGRKRRG